MNLKERKEGYLGRLGKRKGKSNDVIIKEIIWKDDIWQNGLKFLKWTTKLSNFQIIE